MSFFETYALTKVKYNGHTHVRELASKYNGKELKMLQNIDGDVQYKTLSGDDLIQILGNRSHSRMSIMDKVQKHKRSYTRGHRSQNVKKRTRRNTSTMRSMTRSKRSKRQTQRQTKRSSKRRTYRSQHKVDITPDMMKTIY